MYLKRIETENFRGLDEFELHLGPGLNVIVGENNIGKSAILDAIRLPLAPGSTGGDRIWPRESDIYHYNDSSSFKIDLYFGGLTDRQRGLFVQGLNPNPENPNKETVSIHYEWEKGEDDTRGTYTRWVGDRPDTKASLDDGALQRLSWTYLDALRDSSEALEPYKYSRIAKLLLALSGEEDKEDLVGLIEEANQDVQDTEIVKEATREITDRLNETLGGYLAPDAQIAPSDTDFRNILGSLRLQFQERSDGEHRNTDENGLGYNNLLYISTVLAELASTEDLESRLLLVEEPEAHLHPQLQTLLADYLAEASRTSNSAQDRGEGDDDEGKGSLPPPQVLMTSHSTSIASRVNPNQLRVMHRHQSTEQTESTNFEKIDLGRLELRKLSRHFDITKAAIAFAKGVILVEGICEELLIPVLARRLEGDFELDKHGISIIPIHGINFQTLAQLFGEDPDLLGIPCAIVTDGDPPKVSASHGNTDDDKWNASTHGRQKAFPAKNDEEFQRSDTADKIAEICDDRPIHFEHSDVTLEYDLAAAGSGNPKLMAKAWDEAHVGSPEKLTESSVEKKDTLEKKSLHVWREICLSHSSTSKAGFAQELALLLSQEADEANADWAHEFQVPGYLENAFRQVVQAVRENDGQ